MSNVHSIYELLPLPSNGCFYDEYIKVRHLNTEDELFILYLNNINNINIKNILLQRCLIDFDINKLLVGDRDIIFLHLLESAYGNTLTLLVNDKEFEITTNELKIKNIALSTNKNEFSYKLKNGDIIKFKLLTVADEIKTYNLRLVERIKSQIISINNNTNINDISKYFNALPLRESTNFQKYINSVTPGIDNIVEINGDAWTIPIDLSLFGITLENIGKFKDVVDDEVFTLAHYGKGFPYSDIYKMTVSDRKRMISKLYDTKKKEKEIQEKELNSMKNRGKK